jgi:hypothetical protein
MMLGVVSVLGPPAMTAGVYSVDMTWTDPKGHAIHIWQTNMTEFIGTDLDPVTGSALTLAGTTWRSVDHAVGDTVLHVLSVRTPADITVAADTDLDLSVLETVVASLR